MWYLIEGISKTFKLLWTSSHSLLNQYSPLSSPPITTLSCLATMSTSSKCSQSTTLRLLFPPRLCFLHILQPSIVIHSFIPCHLHTGRDQGSSLANAGRSILEYVAMQSAQASLRGAQMLKTPCLFGLHFWQALQNEEFPIGVCRDCTQEGCDDDG